MFARNWHFIKLTQGNAMRHVGFGQFRCFRMTVMLALLPLLAHADEPERRNWFNDPFIQLSDDLSSCPQPAGPYITEQQRREQAHHRLERGTSCWLAGQCEHSNYYGDDAAIAAQMQQAWYSFRTRSKNSLWLTVQGRIVTIQGCAQTRDLASELETMARKIPKVQGVLLQISIDPEKPAPYPVLPPGTPLQ